MYRTKQDAINNPALGEENNEPSMTIKGQYMEMTDIIDRAMKGQEIERSDAQYFAPDDIMDINSLFRASLDLTDLDALKEKTMHMNNKINQALKRKQDELDKQAESEAKNKPEPPIEDK